MAKVYDANRGLATHAILYAYFSSQVRFIRAASSTGLYAQE